MTEHITVSRELLRKVLEPIERATETAMHQTLVARIPESGFFGGIAQDLNWAATELRAALEKPADVPLLTDDEIYEMYAEPRSDGEIVAFAREVEQAVRQKAGMK